MLRDEKREEDQRRRDALIYDVVEQLLPSARSNPTPATVGAQAYEFMNRHHKWNRVRGEGPAVLSPAQCTELESTHFENESHIIRWFTPVLKRIVESAADKSGHDLVMVNTERHPWVQDPHGGFASKPDLLVTHPYFYKWNKTDGDTHFDGEGFLFGQLAHWDLRDCHTAIVEWKLVLKESQTPLGEGVDYVRRMAWVAKDDETFYKPALNDIHVMVAGRDKFLLVSCDRDTPMNCIWGEWSDPGSYDAIAVFFSATQNAWLTAIRTCCTRFQVALVLPSENEASCFLGNGATGRVFKVRTASNTEHVLKVSLNGKGCTRIAAELYKFNNHKGSLLVAKATVMIHCEYVDSTQHFAGLLVSPVGQRLPDTKKAITSAIEGLLRLAQAGLHHGDARRDNVVWVGDQALWVDFECMSAVEAGMHTAMFAQDVFTFARSYIILQTDGIQAAVAAYMEGPDTVAAVVELFQSTWSRSK